MSRTFGDFWREWCSSQGGNHMGARNWFRQRQRTTMQKRGTETAHINWRPTTPASGKPRPLSKAEQRARLDAAVSGYTGAVTKVPAGKRGS